MGQTRHARGRHDLPWHVYHVHGRHDHPWRVYHVHGRHDHGDPRQALARSVQHRYPRHP